MKVASLTLTHTLLEADFHSFNRIFHVSVRCNFLLGAVLSLLTYLRPLGTFSEIIISFGGPVSQLIE